MINIGFGANLLLGFLVVFAATILYFVRVIRPELSRDEDIFFTTIGLIYSCILIVHGWRLDPILLFSQVLIITAALAAGWENIRLRGLIAKKIKEYSKSMNKSNSLK
jgi:multisubunit Na+/H+ antiporter MnhF subunit